MKWTVAYHWNLDEDITIDVAMGMRNGNDPRAGQLHCCKRCFESNCGTRISTKKRSKDGRRAHFAMWKGSHKLSNSQCSAEQLATSKRESMDYAFFYLKFQDYLYEQEKNVYPFFIKNIEICNDGDNDFILDHYSNEKAPFKKTFITIIDENKRKKQKYRTSQIIGQDTLHCILHISEYTPDQLNDFEIGGKKKFSDEWSKMVGMVFAQISAEKRFSESVELNALIRNVDSLYTSNKFSLEKIVKYPIADENGWLYFKESDLIMNTYYRLCQCTSTSNIELGISVDDLNENAGYQHYIQSPYNPKNLTERDFLSIERKKITDLYLSWIKRDFINDYTDFFAIILANIHFTDTKVHVANLWKEPERTISQRIKHLLFIIINFEKGMMASEEALNISKDQSLSSINKLHKLEQLYLSITIVNQPQEIKDEVENLRKATIIHCSSIITIMKKVYNDAKSRWENNIPNFTEMARKDDERLLNERKMLTERSKSVLKNLTEKMRYHKDQDRIKVINRLLDKSFFLRENQSFSPHYKFLFQDL